MWSRVEGGRLVSNRTPDGATVEPLQPCATAPRAVGVVEPPPADLGILYFPGFVVFPEGSVVEYVPYRTHNTTSTMPSSTAMGHRL